VCDCGTPEVGLNIIVIYWKTMYYRCVMILVVMLPLVN